MKTSNVIWYVVAFLISTILMQSAMGLTASIGNARMILYPNMEEGKSYVIDRTIQVNNVNEVPINILLQPMGDIENITEIIDTNFRLLPNETKNARVKITVPEPGTYEGTIGVSFYADNTTKEQGVGLVSSIMIIARVNQTAPTNNRVNQTAVVPPETPGKPAYLTILGVLAIVLILVICVVALRAAKAGEKDGKKPGKKRK